LKNITFTYFFILLFFLLFLDISLGTYYPFTNFFLSLIKLEFLNNKEFTFVLTEIRLPRVFSAISVGAALSISGLLMQTLFRNPLAEPYLLGISSGSSLFVSIILLSSSSILIHPIVKSLNITMASILGALLFTIIILIISYRIKNEITLLIIGLLIATVSNSIITLLQYLSLPENIKNIILWHSASLSGSSLFKAIILFLISLFFLRYLLKNSIKYDTWLLGNDQAISLGINIKKLRLITLVIISILTGFSISLYGPIAFIGIISPHISRLLAKTGSHNILIPLTFYCGMLFMLFIDIAIQLLTISGLIISPPTNSIISIFALPLLINIIIKKKELWI